MKLVEEMKQVEIRKQKIRWKQEVSILHKIKWHSIHLFLESITFFFFIFQQPVGKKETQTEIFIPQDKNNLTSLKSTTICDIVSRENGISPLVSRRDNTLSVDKHCPQQHFYSELLLPRRRLLSTGFQR